MKKIIFLGAQILYVAGALAQPALRPGAPPADPAAAGDAGQVGNVLPVQDSPTQRRIELRAILQSQQNALEQPATERRLTPRERAELREQVREQYQRAAHGSGKP